MIPDNVKRILMTVAAVAGGRPRLELKIEANHHGQQWFSFIMTPPPAHRADKKSPVLPKSEAGCMSANSQRIQEQSPTDEPRDE